MSVPYELLGLEHKKWYVNLVISTILADNTVTPTEVSFIKSIASVIDDTGEKEKILGLLAAKKKPPLVAPPPGIPPAILTAIFMEIIQILICDLDFDRKERDFLETVGDLCSFDKSFQNELMEWCEAGLRWKQQQKLLVNPGQQDHNYGVPVEKMTSSQKSWYAVVLINCIMLDGQVDQMEVVFLKAALGFVDNSKHRKQLAAYIRNRMAPPLKPFPGDLTLDIINKVMMEAIQILVTDQHISIGEQALLMKIAEVCKIHQKQFDKFMDWAHTGISWKNSKDELMDKCRFKKDQKGSVKPSQAVYQEIDGNNAVKCRNVDCFVCETEKMVPIYKLVDKSHKPSTNIFGLTTYREANESFDFIDFNRLMVIVCPNCFFASLDKLFFKKQPNEKPPESLTTILTNSDWITYFNDKKSSYEGLAEELGSVDRSDETVVKTFELAIESLNVINEKHRTDETIWQILVLNLYIAEILTGKGEENAEKILELLNRSREMAQALFDSSQNNSIVIKAARLLFILGLYFNDKEAAGKYLEFLNDLKTNRADGLDKDELTLLNKTHGEAKKAFENREDYLPANLDGFHLRSKSKTTD